MTKLLKFKTIAELKAENKQLKEKVEGYEITRDRLIEMGFPTFMSCREYADHIEKLEQDLKHKKIAIQNRKARIKDLEKQIEKMKNECSVLLDKLYLSGLNVKQITLIEKMQDILGV